jgi:hypothetical protein
MCSVKRCTKCGEIKEETEFYAAKGTKDGLRGDCKACHIARGKAWYAANREQAIACVMRWQQENPDRLREYRLQNRDNRVLQMRKLYLRRTFGMTVEEYSAMLSAQRGSCAICGDPPEDGKSMHIDHDEYGVRGILCVRCNHGLGQFKDDPELLHVAADHAFVGGFAPLWLVRRQLGVN